MGQFLLLGLCVTSGFGVFLHGYNSGLVAHVIANEHFLRFFDTKQSSSIVAAVVSVFAGGCVLGSLCAGFFLDLIGRKRTIQAGAIINIVGTVVQAASVGLTMMMIGRIISGFAIGFTQTAVPIYLAECSTRKNRGFVTGWSQLMVTMGFVATSWVGYASSKVPNAAHNAFTWRFPISIAAIPSIFIAFALNWLPESPRYLVRKGMTEQAYRVLVRLYYDGSNRLDLQRDIHQITIKWNREILEGGADGDSEWKLCFTVPKYRKRLIVAILSQVLTQCTGINMITYYQGDMFENVGIKDSKGLLLGAIYSMVAPVTCFFAQVFLIDRIGRKPMLYFGSVALPILFIVFAAVMASNEKSGYEDGALTKLNIAVMFFFNVFFQLSWGIVGWVMYGEVMPLRIRGKGGAIAAGVGNWAVNCLISQVTPLAMEKLSWKYYFFYSAFMLCVTLPTVHYVFKETKGLSLEELDSLWDAPTNDSFQSLEDGSVNAVPGKGEVGLDPQAQLEMVVPGSRYQRGRFRPGR
ncbi:general substrate transporter [Ascobolus immersus RN42]|uniref:General substrate transporter n=1 Tax=Ascobolus immersus RN42 TaxID=1160509 RepID=A0A3N4HVM6_ASCIM|nr:general substrate transporter [Ascobolus immersus RN42]